MAMAAMPPMARRLAALARHVVGAGGSTTDIRTGPRRPPPALAPHTRPAPAKASALEEENQEKK